MLSIPSDNHVRSRRLARSRPASPAIERRVLGLPDVGLS
ncbi:hypothetical protein FB459_2420 [Yimella lutea]|uniref:Uncharacterized protein n=1 Tax=Yimella lutea TaxID=587872 RepID=A0A542EHX2_9MICO|nr:hypothetical protein FB459_2420 [Yimella lutea]